jgi:hypothetical protein
MLFDQSLTKYMNSHNGCHGRNSDTSQRFPSLFDQFRYSFDEFITMMFFDHCVFHVSSLKGFNQFFLLALEPTYTNGFCFYPMVCFTSARVGTMLWWQADFVPLTLNQWIGTFFELLD